MYLRSNKILVEAPDQPHEVLFHLMVATRIVVTNLAG
jgi:hypothetical protein